MYSIVKNLRFFVRCFPAKENNAKFRKNSFRENCFLEILWKKNSVKTIAATTNCAKFLHPPPRKFCTYFFPENSRFFDKQLKANLREKTKIFASAQKFEILGRHFCFLKKCEIFAKRFTCFAGNPKLYQGYNAL